MEGIENTGVWIEGMFTMEELKNFKHRLQIYRKLRNWHIPAFIVRYIVGKRGVCILQKLIPYKENK